MLFHQTSPQGGEEHASSSPATVAAATGLETAKRLFIAAAHRPAAATAALVGHWFRWLADDPMWRKEMTARLPTASDTALAALCDGLSVVAADDVDVAAALATRLRNPEGISTHVVSALGDALASPLAAAALASVVWRGEPSDVCAAARRVLGCHVHLPAVLATLDEGLQNPAPRVRAAAVRIFSAAVDFAPARMRVHAALSDTSPRVRLAAVRGLRGALNRTEIAAAFETCLTDEAPPVRAAVIRLFGLRQDVGLSMPTLLKLLRDGSPPEAEAAAAAVARHMMMRKRLDEDAVLSLTLLVKSSHAAERRSSAVAALGRLTACFSLPATARDALRQAVFDPATSVRLAAARWLSPRAYADELTLLTRDASPAVVVAAWKTLRSGDLGAALVARAVAGVAVDPAELSAWRWTAQRLGVVECGEALRLRLCAAEQTPDLKRALVAAVLGCTEDDVFVGAATTWLSAVAEDAPAFARRWQALVGSRAGQVPAERLTHRFWVQGALAFAGGRAVASFWRWAAQGDACISLWRCSQAALTPHVGNELVENKVAVGPLRLASSGAAPDASTYPAM